MYDFEYDNEILEMLERAKDKDLSIEIINLSKDKFDENDVIIEDYRWKSYVNHMIALIDRVTTGERLDEMDISIFSELSDKSVNIAKEIMDLIEEDMGDGETYMIAVHIDTAMNEKK